jgi:hypothetical protein
MFEDILGSALHTRKRTDSGTAPLKEKPAPRREPRASLRMHSIAKPEFNGVGLVANLHQG